MWCASAFAFGSAEAQDSFGSAAWPEGRCLEIDAR